MWETLTHKQVAKRLGQVKTKYTESNTEQFRYSEYTDNATGEKIIRIVPVPNA
jgi:hypothetical protein